MPSSPEKKNLKRKWQGNTAKYYIGMLEKEIQRLERLRNSSNSMATDKEIKKRRREIKQQKLTVSRAASIKSAEENERPLKKARRTEPTASSQAPVKMKKRVSSSSTSASVGRTTTSVSKQQSPSLPTRAPTKQQKASRKTFSRQLPDAKTARTRPESQPIPVSTTRPLSSLNGPTATTMSKPCLSSDYTYHGKQHHCGAVVQRPVTQDSDAKVVVPCPFLNNTFVPSTTSESVSDQPSHDLSSDQRLVQLNAPHDDSTVNNSVDQKLQTNDQQVNSYHKRHQQHVPGWKLFWTGFFVTLSVLGAILARDWNPSFVSHGNIPICFLDSFPLEDGTVTQACEDVSREQWQPCLADRVCAGGAIQGCSHDYLTLDSDGQTCKLSTDANDRITEMMDLLGDLSIAAKCEKGGAGYASDDVKKMAPLFNFLQLTDKLEHGFDLSLLEAANKYAVGGTPVFVVNDNEESVKLGLHSSRIPSLPMTCQVEQFTKSLFSRAEDWTWMTLKGGIALFVSFLRIWFGSLCERPVTTIAVTIVAGMIATRLVFQITMVPVLNDTVQVFDRLCIILYEEGAHSPQHMKDIVRYSFRQYSNNLLDPRKQEYFESRLWPRVETAVEHDSRILKIVSDGGAVKWQWKGPDPRLSIVNH